MLWSRSRILTSPKRTVFLLFCILWILLIVWNYDHARHDPSSFLFSSTHGHEKIYSLRREREADAFISEANHGLHKNTLASPLEPIDLCLAVATVVRPGEQYISRAIGSIFHGLSSSERSRIHFAFLIAHTNESVHPLANQPWITSLPDTRMSYQNLDEDKIAEIASWEHDNDYISKGLFDYTFMLETCYNETNAPYVAVFEGDILAVEGWYPRAMAALKQIDVLDKKHEIYEPTKDEPTASWLYLRLFYTEHFIAWNSEEWPLFTTWCVGGFSLFATTLLILRVSFPKHLGYTLSNRNLPTILFIYTPLTIGLFFALGRSTIAGMSQTEPAGLQQMNNYGCCSQGHVYPRRMIPFAINKVKERSRPYVDMLMEGVADSYNLQRWTVNPSLLQHVGSKSSKGDDVADERAKMMWSYGFERWGRNRALRG